MEKEDRIGIGEGELSGEAALFLERRGADG